MRLALDRLVTLANGSTSEPFADGDTILSMRGKIRTEFLAGKAHPGDDSVLRKFKSSMWFDFRRLQVKSDGDMAAFGKELIDAGFAKLPFDTCVFVFPFMSESGEKVSAGYLLEQIDLKVLLKGAFFFGNGKPIGYCAAEEIEPSEAVYYAIAVLASRQTVKTNRSLSVGNVHRPRPDNSYVEISLSFASGNRETRLGTHASPRLHWRRGHIRRLTEKTTWVRPTLVGVDSGGVVLHDYRTARSHDDTKEA
jgi:hypothetical protein